MLRKSGVKKEDISRVFDNVKDRFVLGYKLLLSTFFDGKTTIPCDFSLHQEKGKRKLSSSSDSEIFEAATLIVR